MIALNINALTAADAVTIAALAAGLNQSALLCLADAHQHLDYGRDNDAMRRAAASLRYSVGVLHPDYIRVAGAVRA